MADRLGRFALSILLAMIAVTARADDAPRVVRLGVATDTDRALIEAAAPAGLAQGVRLEAVAFADAGKAAAALAAGQIDGSVAQDAQVVAANPQVCAAGYTVTYPMGLYAQQLAALREVPVGGVVALPADRAGQGRALLLLQRYGLVRLDSAAGLTPRPKDIVDNPRKLRWHTLPAARLPGALRTSALVAMPYATAASANLAPARDAIGMEDARVPWANVLAVRAADCGAGWAGATVAALHAPAVKTFILARFNDSVRRPW
ncbi:lipoprotein, YaeC family [Cupriavidus sp. OV038]|jgi:YaeC family lipoprotein|uniref:MetQ/NlpA family ABC transporter substrate-binding protein n=1 Tax=unclassified Cupriavidus TaxID=2640874 RepID=UPI0008EADF4B|nr:MULTISPECIES: MetQ/NlpA family ABC transporter substrate-binding protein [unclassified Cupriavidus]SFC23023.1 lipoprotein, YaeC family [Cupriavidus sp. OV038]SFP16955.1 lipoprotein, YaeC family [Cupriavidus sp. OV096]